MIASYLENEVRLESWIELKGVEGFRRGFPVVFGFFVLKNGIFKKGSKFI